jgi:hypothetical protein
MILSSPNLPYTFNSRNSEWSPFQDALRICENQRDQRYRRRGEKLKASIFWQAFGDVPSRTGAASQASKSAGSFESLASAKSTHLAVYNEKKVWKNVGGIDLPRSVAWTKEVAAPASPLPCLVEPVPVREGCWSRRVDPLVLPTGPFVLSGISMPLRPPSTQCHSAGQDDLSVRFPHEQGFLGYPNGV